MGILFLIIIIGLIAALKFTAPYWIESSRLNAEEAARIRKKAELELHGTVDIRGLDKGAVLACLYNNSMPLGVVVLVNAMEEHVMTAEEGKAMAGLLS